ncbi:MAG: HAD-IA family hydrolase [Clostridia bacterium]|nr:HAD-IA family hydrolase [Clostridia bacterium]
MKYKAYIFDLDGTLLDTLLDLANAVNYAMRAKGYPERTVQEVRGFIGNGIRVLIKRAVPEGTSNDDYEEALAIFTKYYLEHIADYTKPYDGMIDVVKTLQQRGCKVAVLSNKAHFAAQAVVKDFFGDIFDMVVGKMDEFPTKPEPDSLFYTMKTLGVTAEESVYIGDSDVDVLTAHNAGLPCIGVTWGNRDEDVLLASGAEYIAHTPDEILNI